MPDFVMKLGDFAFQRFEVPETIGSKTSQMLAVHKFPGGKRIIDAMGRDYEPISWSGSFQGAGALARYRALEALVNAGQSVVLSWSQFNYLVMPQTISRDFQREYQILYQISVEVIEDRTATLAPGAGPSLDDMMDGDAVTATSLAGLIDDSGLTSAIAAVQSAVDGVNSFITATTAQINTVLLPIATAQAQVTTLITNIGATVANASTLGGVLPGNPITSNVAALNQQIASMTSLPNLYSLGSVLGRMNKNLTSKQQSGKLLTTAGGSLYRVAAAEYGDPSAWTGIAKANDLTDPEIQGVQTITVPPSSDGAGGVWTP